ncbi:hypothetical protein BHM03_00016496 [Ensete ventricosum]|nr:hypothetical protein BHM03_00016496 [Ensete ventricosum]
MELFSAAPDLSLQISSDDATPPSWRKPDETMGLGFRRRDVCDSSSTTTTYIYPITASAANAKAAPLELSLANTNAAVSIDHRHHHPPLPEVCHRDQSWMKPITGIPIYQHPPSFPLLAPHQQQHLCGPSSSTHGFTPFMTGQSLSRSRYLPSRFPGRRSMRAPRMRWTTTLHARFVHAVELLGGHESMLQVSHIICMDRSCLSFMTSLPSIVSEFRSYTQVSSRAHGCERSYLGSCEIPPAGNPSSLKSRFDLLFPFFLPPVPS